jgi:hypothetical protein
MNQIAKVIASVQAVLLASLGIAKPGVSAMGERAAATGDEPAVSAPADASSFLLLAAGSAEQIEDAFDQVVTSEVATARAMADAAAKEILVAKLDLDNVSPSELDGQAFGAGIETSVAPAAAPASSTAQADDAAYQ